MRKPFYSLYPSIDECAREVRARGISIIQGYLLLETGYELADRLKVQVDFTASEAQLRNKAGKLLFNMKGDGGIERNELPDIPVPEALFGSYWKQTQGRRIFKMRHEVPYAGYTLELDLYTDRPLIIAELEVQDKSVIPTIAPLGLDVSDMEKYKNRNLAK